MLRSHMLTAVALLGFPSVAFAQGGEVVDCSNDEELFIERDGYKLYHPDCLRDQASRSRDARDAYKSGDLYESAKIYESLIEVRPLNVYHLSLGRTYQRLNMCFEAREQFEKANDSRESIDVPNPPDVPGLVTRFRKELKEQDTCFGQIDLQCDPVGMTLEYDTLEYIQDPKSKEWMWRERRVKGDICAKDTSLDLPPGEQKIIATYAGETQEFVVTSSPMSQTIFPVTILPKDPVIKDPVSGNDPVRDGLNPKDTRTGDTKVDVTVNIDNTKHKPNPALGWTLIGAGAAVLVGGLLYDTCLFQQGGINDQIDAAMGSPTFNSANDTLPIEDAVMCEEVTYSDVVNPRNKPFNSAPGCACSGRVDRTIDFSDAIGPIAYIAGSLLAINGVIRF